MEDVRVLVANFLGSGDQFTRCGSRRFRDALVFHCDGYTLRFTQARKIVTSRKQKFAGRFTRSTEVVVSNVPEGDVGDALSVVDRVCWLLSFAGLSRVVRYGYEYPDGSGFTHYRSVGGETSYF